MIWLLSDSLSQILLKQQSTDRHDMAPLRQFVTDSDPTAFVLTPNLMHE